MWLSAANDFNDIFEVVPRYDSLLTDSIEEALKKEFAFLPPSVAVDWQTYKKQMRQSMSQLYRESIETLPQGFQDKFSQHFGIICFSENLNSPIMWGHYAKNHSGFAVEFDPLHQVFPREEFGKVEYSHDRPVAEVREYWKILLTKSMEWKYESEHRLIKPLPLSQKATRRDRKEKHYIDLPLNSVRAVYFGCRILTEARDEILRDMDTVDWKHVEKFGMRRHDTEYAVREVAWGQFQTPPADARRDFDVLWTALGL